jgi:hypothetical protein
VVQDFGHCPIIGDWGVNTSKSDKCCIRVNLTVEPVGQVKKRLPTVVQRRIKIFTFDKTYQSSKRGKK